MWLLSGSSMTSAPSSNEYFPPGTMLLCTTFLNEEYKGEVIVFDHQSNFLCLKYESTNGNEKLNDVVVLHMTYVKDVKVLKEGSEVAVSLKPLNHNKLRKRFHQEKRAKLNLSKAISLGVSEEGQKIFAHINKTFELCQWEEKDILVMDEIIISPPYKPENCSAKDVKNAGALDHIKKVVTKFYSDLERN